MILSLNHPTSMHLTAIILTYNESKHLARCINSLSGIAQEIVVVDSFSNDDTVDIARRLNAIVLSRKWTNHSDQFNWSLGELKFPTDWILRIDADEVITPELSASIQTELPKLTASINGVYLRRRMKFLGKEIRWGGVFPTKVLRIFRPGHGASESRLMDEHITVTGSTTELTGELIDDNLNSITWWTAKHNRYSSLEATEMLDLEYKFISRPASAIPAVSNQPGLKRWIKERIYARLPEGFRAFAYFFYRYIIRFGFLDGRAGTAFHFLQGFWYRYLVDTKVAEVKAYMNRTNVNIRQAVSDVLDVQV